MEKFRESRQQELSQVTEEGRRSRLLIDINLSYFNSGIAYLLHLENYQAAIDMFEPLLELNDDISANALTFSAYSAAKIGNIELAQQLLPRAENERDGNDSIDHYLACYRRLTEQVWQPTLDMSDCLNIADDTALEVKIPLFKTLAENSDEKIKIYGLTKLRDLFVSDIEKKLRKQTSQSASNVEIKRLQRESDLKTVVLEQQKQLQTALDEKHENRTKLFLATFVIFLFMIFFIFNRFKHKKVLAEQFERMSLRDALTKVGNRRFLEQNIERELAFVRRQYEQDQSTYLAFFIFDVDHFKKVNDTYGHSVGDEVLVEMAQRVGDLVRDTDLFVRWGGEEFIGIFRLSNKQHAVLLADRILTCINERPFSVNHGREQLSISCSIGVTLFPFINTENINDWTKLVSLADLALYHGKSIGRNCWVLIENVGIQNESEVNSLMNQPLEQSIAKGIVNVRTSRDQRLP
ncbi:MAG: GGDEF domain-containing protein, partial [Oceanospirillaceae bacterium]|nr:GGDEF domain-containing protein [Oceanospirillaceae bacterium]